MRFRVICPDCQQEVCVDVSDASLARGAAFEKHNEANVKAGVSECLSWEGQEVSITEVVDDEAAGF